MISIRHICLLWASILVLVVFCAVNLSITVNAIDRLEKDHRIEHVVELERLEEIDGAILYRTTISQHKDSRPEPGYVNCRMYGSGKMECPARYDVNEILAELLNMMDLDIERVYPVRTEGGILLERRRGKSE